MAKIVGVFWDTETDVPIHDGDVYLRTVDGKESIFIEVTFPDGARKMVEVSAPTDMDGKFTIHYAPPGEYMLVAKSFIHHPAKLMLVGEDALIDPGIQVRLETTPARI